ncbi:hypothetical protein HanIR_Chr03g0108881 [Helianthus annuus]|nr:hypothetical protein HanIR_Chr03g0108881 [Helianthus annuus]
MDDRSKPDNSVLGDRGKPPLPYKSLASRVVNIDGNPVLPRRGSVQVSQQESKKFNVIDELTKITIPVAASECEVAGTKLAADVNTQGTHPINESTAKPMSYADSVVAQNLKKVYFRSLASSAVHDGCDIVLPRESVRMVQDKLANTLYGYFLGDRVAFPVVNYFVPMNWKKYGLQKTMMNANDFFFFKFKI